MDGQEKLLRAIYEDLGAVKQQITDVAEEGKQERSRIYAQTAKTNGRVTLIEQWINDYKIRKDERNRLAGKQNNIHDSNVNIKPRAQWFEDEFIRKFIIALTGVATLVAAYLGVR